MSGKSGIVAAVAAAAGVLLSASPSFGQTPVYDIRAELIFHKPASAWVVQIRNVGPTIPGPVRAEYHLAIPAGAKIVNWTLNQMQCAPTPPLTGSVNIVCQKNLSSAWAAGTILSNQLFFAAAASPGTTLGRTRACIRVLLFLPDPSGNYQLAPEVSTANNSACA